MNGEKVDIDIGFAKYKSGEVLDTNRALESRLQAIRDQHGQERYSEVIANIRLAKTLLKEAEVYKK